MIEEVFGPNRRTRYGFLATDREGPARSTFDGWTYEPQTEQTHLLHVAGQPLVDWRARKTLGVVRKSLQASFSPMRTIELLAEQVRAMAAPSCLTGIGM